jgi:hypothetical protein
MLNPRGDGRFLRLPHPRRHQGALIRPWTLRPVAIDPVGSIDHRNGMMPPRLPRPLVRAIIAPVSMSSKLLPCAARAHEHQTLLPGGYLIAVLLCLLLPTRLLRLCVAMLLRRHHLQGGRGFEDMGTCRSPRRRCLSIGTVSAALKLLVAKGTPVRDTGDRVDRSIVEIMVWAHNFLPLRMTCCDQQRLFVIPHICVRITLIVISVYNTPTYLFRSTEMPAIILALVDASGVIS